MSLKIITYLILPVYIFSCAKGQKKYRPFKVEVIDYIVKQYNPAETDLSKPFWDFTEKIWFADSFAIEEVRQLNITEDSKGKGRKSYDILHYRFTDLRRQLIYEFKTFTDTAKAIRKYTFMDSIPVVSGWGFNKTKNWEYMGTTRLMPDTLLGNTIYKRAKISKVLNEVPYTLLCYFDCAHSGTIFNMDPGLSEKTGCPLVKLYYFSPQKKGLHMTLEVRFIRNTLTEEEKKILDAWKKYAKENP